MGMWPKRALVLLGGGGGGSLALWWWYQVRNKKSATGQVQPISCTLLSMKPLTSEVAVFRFGIPASDKNKFELSPLAHVLALDNATTYRSYTPLDLDSSEHFDILVKRYPAGRLSGYIHRLKPGDTMDFVPVLSHFQYQPNRYTTLGMVAGGSGIAPMLQLIRRISVDPNDHTCVSLVYACKSPQETYFKQELDALVQRFPERFRVSYVWGSTRVDKAMLTTHFLGDRSIDSVLVSGPPGLLTSLCGPGSKDGEEKALQPPLGGLLRETGFDDVSVWRL